MNASYNRILLPLGSIPMREFVSESGKKGMFRDGSFIPYIVEELITRSAFQVVFDYSPEGFKSTIPDALKERVEWVDSNLCLQKSLDFLAPAFDELQIGTDGRGFWIKKENSTPEDNENLHYLANITHNLEYFLLAIEKRLQLDLDINSLQRSLFHLRNALRDSEGRARIAVLEGIVGSYQNIDSPCMIAIPSSSEIIIEHFQRLISDTNFLELSKNAMELGYTQKSKRALEIMRRNIRDLINNKYFKKGFNQGAKAISLAAQVHVPQTEVAESLLSRGYLPPIISLVEPIRMATKLWEQQSPIAIPPDGVFGINEVIKT